MTEKDDRLVLNGDVDSVMPFLHRSKIFVCPIRSGSGMRGKVLEAMATGLPVVSTWNGAEGIPVHMGRSGFMADTPKHMIDQIEVLLDDPPLRERMGTIARDMVTERFTWTRSAELLEQTLMEVVARRRYDYTGGRKRA